jgi:hypothetical protein
MNELVTEIRKRIVSAITLGQDTSVLELSLREARLAETTKGEVAELKSVVERRRQYQNSADAIKDKFAKQGQAIDAFLASRDKAIATLDTLMGQLQELQKFQDASFKEYFRPLGGILSEVGKLPVGYFPPDLKCPELLSVFHLNLVKSVLSGCHRYEHNLRPDRFAEDELGKPGAEQADEPKVSVGVTCVICSHLQKTAIEKALADGASYRAIEAQYPGVSRSSLSRHKQHIKEV